MRFEITNDEEADQTISDIIDDLEKVKGSYNKRMGVRDDYIKLLREINLSINDLIDFYK